LLGRSGSGKSTLINLILGENKSLEGGNGFSTTSKNIIVYKKTGIPIRLYDVKGIENENSVDNYLKILTDFNQNNSNSKDDYAIFYCIDYNKRTTIEKMEFKIYEKLVEIKKKIYFIITKINYDINKEPEDKKTKETRENHREEIENAIKDKIKNICQERQINGEDFIKNYITIDYVNLVRNYEVEPYVPVCGIDKVLSYFSKLYSDEKWKELEYYCSNKNDQKCKEYCEKNYFLKKYSFNNINERNKNEANKYLFYLGAGAMFSGMVPGVDIGMEYFYKSKFKEKLESLYGFNYDEALKVYKEELKKEIDDLEIKMKEEKGGKDLPKKNNNLTKENKSINSPDNEDSVYRDEPTIPLKGNKNFISKDYEKKMNDKKKEEEEMNINNFGKNTTSIIRGGGEIGSIILKVLPTAGEVTLESGAVVVRTGISVTTKAVSWVLLPVTCLVFGTWSMIKVDKDCKKMLKIFKGAHSLRFKTLLAYIKSFRKAIEYLKSRGEKIIEEDNEEK